MRVGVVGGGINGLMTAWLLAKGGHSVVIFEKNELMRATSSSSSKLLHGGLRYLESGQFSLVREALSERDRWLNTAPDLTSQLRIVYPIAKKGGRLRLSVWCGLWMYRILSAKSGLPPPCWLSKKQLYRLFPELKPDAFVGGFAFYDGQMDDLKLGLWVAEQCRSLGVLIRENVAVDRVDHSGNLFFDGGKEQFDCVVNVAGPWAERLLLNSKMNSPVRLDLVRGSHLILERRCNQAFLLEVPNERRIFFVLPWKEGTLVGTTEVRQSLNEPIACSESEVGYLINAYNRWMASPISRMDVKEIFSGLRPLLYSKDDPSQASREYSICREGRLINVFGGKWTTSHALASKVCAAVIELV